MTVARARDAFGPRPGRDRLLETAGAACRDGLFRRAIGLINGALRRDRTDCQAWEFKTWLLRHLGLKPLVAKMLEAALARGAPRVLLVSLGCERFDEGRFEAAIEAYDRWLESPEAQWTASVLSNKANALFALRRARDARPLYEQAIALEPHRTSHTHNYLRLLSEHRDWDRALAAIEAALPHSSDDAERVDLLTWRSWIHAEQDQGEPALAAASEAVRLAPESIRARYLFGRGLALVGRLEEARQELQRVLAQDAENEDARRGIAMIDSVLALRRPWWRRLFL